MGWKRSWILWIAAAGLVGSVGCSDDSIDDGFDVSDPEDTAGDTRAPDDGGAAELGDAGGACPGSDPSGCDSDDDCAGDEVCKDDPESCDPSSCFCSNGGWACTEDCGGTVCMTP